MPRNVIKKKKKNVDRKKKIHFVLNYTPINRILSVQRKKEVTKPVDYIISNSIFYDNSPQTSMQRTTIVRSPH